MIKKDASLIKKEGGKEYFRNSYLILFKFFREDFNNAVLYISLFLLGYLIYTTS